MSEYLLVPVNNKCNRCLRIFQDGLIIPNNSLNVVIIDPWGNLTLKDLENGFAIIRCYCAMQVFFSVLTICNLGVICALHDQNRIFAWSGLVGLSNGRLIRLTPGKGDSLTILSKEERE